MNTAELLAPAGSFESLEAALASGADAVYLGSGRLNTRGERAQFPPDELERAARRVHEAGAKLYLTLNILLRDDELEEALEMAAFAARAGADACIVQDRGLMRLLARELPELPVHASTQCTAGSKEALKSYHDLGCRRVVLPRELSLEEIAELTTYAHSLGMEIEVFVHGALCMSVSGQCHMSHFMGGRSANRGDCAQCCRMSYRMTKDGELFRREGAWLSPRDISAFSILDRLLDTGIDALKIEGRLRRPDYVGQTTAVFRKALNELEEGKKASEVLSSRRERDLKIAFNRGGSFNQAYWTGRRDADFLSPERTGHEGLYLGEVSEIIADKGIVRVWPDQDLEKDYVPQPQSQISLRAAADDEGISAPCGVIRRIASGRILEFKGFHPKLLRRLRLPLFAVQMNQPSVPEQAEDLRRKEKLDMHFYKNAEGFYTLDLRSPDKRLRFTEQELPERPAVIEKPLPPERIRRQLGKLGSSPYRPGEIRADVELPWRIKDLNALRRQALEAFAALPAASASSGEKGPAIPAPLSGTELPDFSGRTFYPFIVSMPFWRGGRLPAPLETYPLLFLLPLGELLEAGSDKLKAIASTLHPQARLGVLLPPQLSLKRSEEFFKQLASLRKHFPLAALAQGPSGLPAMARRFGLGDLSLIAWQGSQIWNAETVKALAYEGYDHFMMSPELSGEEMLLLKEHSSAAYRERLISWTYGRTQAMFTRFCPTGFSRGPEKCGLCKEGFFELIDRKERHFPALPRPWADCSFELFQSEPLRTERLPESLGGGGRAWVFTRETEAEIERIMDASFK